MKLTPIFFLLSSLSCGFISSAQALEHKDLPIAPDFEVIKVDTNGKPYQCNGNALISYKNGVSNLTTLKYFGTSISIDIYDNEVDNLNKVLCNSLNVIQKYHYLASNYSTYPHVTNIKSINNAPEKLHHIEPELTELLEASIDWHDKSEGFFNIALSPIIDIWRGYRAQCKGQRKLDDECDIPTEAELNSVKHLIDIDNINLDTVNNTIQMQAGMSIDLGGVAKGWMAEMVYRQLKADGVNNFMINAGGNIRHYGIHPEGRNFTTAIEDPICKKFNNSLSKCLNFNGQFHEVVTGQDISLVSSGNYLRYYRVQGKEYHHIINPKTLFPKATGVATTVVMNSNHIYADIISTMLFLMPLENAVKYVNEHDELEAVWYLNDDGEKVTSNNFKNYQLKH